MKICISDNFNRKYLTKYAATNELGETYDPNFASQSNEIGKNPELDQERADFKDWDNKYRHNNAIAWQNIGSTVTPVAGAAGGAILADQLLGKHSKSTILRILAAVAGAGLGGTAGYFAGRYGPNMFMDPNNVQEADDIRKNVKASRDIYNKHLKNINLNKYIQARQQQPDYAQEVR